VCVWVTFVSVHRDVVYNIHLSVCENTNSKHISGDGAHTRTGCVPTLRPGQQACVSAVLTVSPSVFARNDTVAPTLFQVFVRYFRDHPGEMEAHTRSETASVGTDIQSDQDKRFDFQANFLCAHTASGGVNKSIRYQYQKESNVCGLLCVPPPQYNDVCSYQQHSHEQQSGEQSNGKKWCASADRDYDMFVDSLRLALLFASSVSASSGPRCVVAARPLAETQLRSVFAHWQQQEQSKLECCSFMPSVSVISSTPTTNAGKASLFEAELQLFVASTVCSAHTQQRIPAIALIDNNRVFVRSLSGARGQWLQAIRNYVARENSSATSIRAAASSNSINSTHTQSQDWMCVDLESEHCVRTQHCLAAALVHELKTLAVLWAHKRNPAKVHALSPADQAESSLSLSSTASSLLYQVGRTLDAPSELARVHLFAQLKTDLAMLECLQLNDMDFSV
jgi:hypothetical protein